MPLREDPQTAPSHTGPPLTKSGGGRLCKEEKLLAALRPNGHLQMLSNKWRSMGGGVLGLEKKQEPIH